jgi:hypothetical protein
VGGGKHPRSSPLPPPLAAFLADPAITVVGFAWDSGDEVKARATWGIGRRDGLFGERRSGQRPAAFAFVDAQTVARAMGYASLGLGALAARVLGVALPKSAAVARSPWGAPATPLSPDQVRYAALDALAAGHLLRGLRLLHWHWVRGSVGGAACHDAPACPACAVPVGAVIVAVAGDGNGDGDDGGTLVAGCGAGGPAAHAARPPICADCGSAFADGQALANHARATGHGCGGAPCDACGRWVGGDGGGDGRGGAMKKTKRSLRG